MQEEAALGVGLQGVVAWDPGVPAEDEGGSVPECLVLLPLGQSDLAAGAGGQEVVWSVGCLEGNSRGICEDESRMIPRAEWVNCVNYKNMMSGWN